MKYKEWILYSKTVTWTKTWNALKLFLSYYISRILNKPILWGQPITISIEPTTSCNLRCPECPSGLRSFTRPTGMLSFSLYEKFINDIYRTTSYVLFYFQGEPYLNKHFLDFIKLAKKFNLYTATSTNGHYLTSEIAKETIVSGLDRLIVSIDGVTQEVYEQYRVGGELPKVIDGVKNVVHWKKLLKSKSPYIIFQFLVVKPNEHQIKLVETLAKELGVDEVVYKTAQIYDYKKGSPLIPDNSKYSRYALNNNGEYQIKNRLDNHCWKLWHQSVMTWDGTIVPCCFDKDAQYQMGRLNDLDFQSIWKDKKYINFRKQLIKGRNQIEMCTNCTEGTKIWAE
jgi:radical SAM protein with 4Fe4S-binding SPASM domain